MVKLEETKEVKKDNWVTYAEIQGKEVIAIKKENNIKLYLLFSN